MLKSEKFLSFIALCKSQIGVSQTKLKMHLDSSEDELKHLFEIARHYGIKFKSSFDENDTYWMLESPFYWNRILFTNQEILHLIRPQIWEELPHSLKEKLTHIISEEVFYSIQSVYPNQVTWNQNFNLKASYQLSYFSRKSKKYERRIITPSRLIRIGSQQIIEGYCFKRKSIRWFEIGRIKYYKQISYQVIPEKPRYYFKTMTLKFDDSILEHIKWLFHDILLTYSNNTVSIRYSEIENIKKEIICLDHIEIYK